MPKKGKLRESRATGAEDRGSRYKKRRENDSCDNDCYLLDGADPITLRDEVRDDPIATRLLDSLRIDASVTPCHAARLIEKSCRATQGALEWREAKAKGRPAKDMTHCSIDTDPLDPILRFQDAMAGPPCDCKESCEAGSDCKCSINGLQCGDKCSCWNWHQLASCEADCICQCAADGHRCTDECPCPDCPRKTIKRCFRNNPTYVPCRCKGKCETDKCSCFARGTQCDRFCGCPTTCQRRYPGCSCDSKKSSISCRPDLERMHESTCDCVRHGRECDPSLCRCSETCCVYRNMLDVEESTRCVVVGKSLVCDGYGLFYADVDTARRGDYICEYRGEALDDLTASRRSFVYDYRETNYVFDTTAGFCIDAERFGSIARFINEPSRDPQEKDKKLRRENVSSRVLQVNGQARIALFAVQNIRAGDELLMHYHGTYDMYQRQQAEREAAAALSSQQRRLKHQLSASLVNGSPTKLARIGTNVMTDDEMST